MDSNLITQEGKEHHVVSYLKDIRQKVDDIEQLKGIRQSTYDIAAGLRSSGTSESVSGTANTDRLSKALTKLEEIEDRLAASISAYEAYIDIAMRVCPPSKVECYIVWLRVVKDMRWKQVANEVGYGTSTVRDKYKIGIDQIYETMPWIWRRNPDAPEAWVDEWSEV